MGQIDSIVEVATRLIAYKHTGNRQMAFTGCCAINENDIIVMSAKLLILSSCTTTLLTVVPVKSLMSVARWSGAILS